LLHGILLTSGQNACKSAPIPVHPLEKRPSARSLSTSAENCATYAYCPYSKWVQQECQLWPSFACPSGRFASRHELNHAGFLTRRSDTLSCFAQSKDPLEVDYPGPSSTEVPMTTNRSDWRIPDNPERRLWLAVLVQAVEDWQSANLRQQREAETFLFSDQKKLCFCLRERRSRRRNSPP